MELFRRFKDAPAAHDLADWLRLRGIQASVSDNSGYFDPSFAHSILSREWSVHIAAGDFTRATEELRHFYEQRLERVPADYYLFAFNDNELEDILIKPDEWGDLDYALARHILADRGKSWSDAELSDFRDRRYQSLSMPETEETGSYLAWGFTLSVVGGLIGSMIGWHLMNSHKILPDGKKVHRFTTATRAKGRYIFWLGIAVTIIFALLRMYWSYQHGIGDL